MHRRALVALALALGATACSAAVAQTRSAEQRTQPAKHPAGRAITATDRTSLRSVARAASYPVPSTEAYPAAKRVAERVALALTTYAPGTNADQLAATVTTDPSRQHALAAAIGPLLHGRDRSLGTVVYPQMGGSTVDTASVMVVTRQVLTSPDGTTTTETRTLDVWLARTGNGWMFDHLDSAGGTPVPRPANLAPDAVAVLDNPRITMPDTARWDIYRGAISPVLLQLLDQIARHYTIAITVLKTGHPYDVYGTSHVSMHSLGRAADINLVDGTHVIDQHAAGSPADALVHWLMLQPSVGQVGSPWDLDGPGARSFTNSIHLDHIHVSV